MGPSSTAILGSSAISAGAGLLGGYTSAEKSAQASKEAALLQATWEQIRATHAHQWEMEDLKKAGLNPILAAGGSGAVTGGISAPMPDTSGYTSAGQAIAEAVNSFVENKNKQADTALKAEQAANVAQDTTNKFTENGLLKAQQDMLLAKLGLVPYEEAKLKAEAEIKKVEARFKEQQEFSNIVKNYATAIGTVIGAGGLTASAISKIAQMKNKAGGIPSFNNYESYNQGPWEGSYLTH